MTSAEEVRQIFEEVGVGGCGAAGCSKQEFIDAAKEFKDLRPGTFVCVACVIGRAPLLFFFSLGKAL